MKIVLATDHAGFELKEVLKPYLVELGYEVEDKGAYELDPADDYPDFISLAAKAVSEDPENTRGIVVGGSGQAEAMTANRFSNVRAALFYGPMLPQSAVDVTGKMSEDPFEFLKLSREHNDSNILSLGARFLTEEQAKYAVKLWLETKFSGAERHARRHKKIEKYS